MVNYEDGYAQAMGSEHSSPMLPGTYFDHNLNQIVMTNATSTDHHNPTRLRAMSSQVACRLPMTNQTHRNEPAYNNITNDTYSKDSYSPLLTTPLQTGPTPTKVEVELQRRVTEMKVMRMLQERD